MPTGEKSAKNNKMNFAIILAAGQGKRMRGTNKLFFKIKGKPLIFYTIRAFEKHPQINKIILVIRKKEVGRFLSLIKKYNLKKICATVAGGKERQDSALAGFKIAESLGARKEDLLLFHNGANPLVTGKEILKALKMAKKYGAAVVGRKAKDTIKEIDNKSFVIKTLERKNIFLAQTPQVLEYALAEKAFKMSRKKGYKKTDDVGLIEIMGERPKAVPCSSRNIKVTTKDDLKIIEAFLDK